MTVSTASAGATGAEIVQAQKEYLLPSLLHMYSEPLTLVEGEGVRVRDAEGREYRICSAASSLLPWATAIRGSSTR